MDTGFPELRPIFMVQDLTGAMSKRTFHLQFEMPLNEEQMLFIKNNYNSVYEQILPKVKERFKNYDDFPFNEEVRRILKEGI